MKRRLSVGMRLDRLSKESVSSKPTVIFAQLRPTPIESCDAAPDRTKNQNKHWRCDTLDHQLGYLGQPRARERRKNAHENRD